MRWSLGCGFWSFWALLVKVGAGFTLELKVVADKCKDNINVCVGVCFGAGCGFLEIS